MNLEKVEEFCVAFLAQTANPLVPFSALYRHVVQRDATADVSPEELLGFLRPNPLFRVVEGDELDGTAEEAVPQDDPRVILATRVPTQKELVAQIDAEMEKMVTALQRALFEASRDDDASRRNEILEMIKRAESLRQRFGKTL